VILRPTIYWLLSILLLLLCLTYPKPIPENTPINPVNLTSYLDVEPNFFYYINNRFHAKVVGQLRLDIKTDRISEDISQYNALIIEGYHYKLNTEFSLNWQVNEQTFQQVFNQTTQSINPINFQTEDTKQIKDLHLLITSTQDLGLNNSFLDEVSFQSIRFDQLNNLNQLATNLSEWNHFNPIKLSSINGYTSSTDFQYKHLILRLSCWLVLTVFLYWVSHINGAHLMLSLFLAWAISSYFYFSNHIKQHNQINQAFLPEQNIINRTDQEIHDLAGLIAAQLKTHTNELSSSDKMILLGTNTFLKLRLIHHLPQFNIGLRINLRKLLKDSTTSKYTFILVENQLKYCQKPGRFKWISKRAELIHVDEKFCLLRKK
jgi:hypothetical protein